MPMSSEIQTILVPQGAEHQAVCQGLRQVSNPPAVFPIPVGAIALTVYLERLQQARCFFEGQRVLIMGLCGGLTPDLAVGDRVLYETCTTTAPDFSEKVLSCDRSLTDAIAAKLRASVQRVRAVTSDRVVSQALAKQQLGQQLGVDVVDMEGFAALQLLATWGVSVATLRVVSDDCQHDIPDLTHAFDTNGSLKPAVLTVAFLKQPIAALRLIRGSTRSLKILQNLTSELFESVI